MPSAEQDARNPRTPHPGRQGVPSASLAAPSGPAGRHLCPRRLPLLPPIKKKKAKGEIPTGTLGLRAPAGTEPAWPKARVGRPRAQGSEIAVLFETPQSNLICFKIGHPRS